MPNNYTRDYRQPWEPRRSRARGWPILAALWLCAGAGATVDAPPTPDRASVAAPLGPTLRELVEAALAHNLELAAAGAGIDQRLAALDAARAHYWPALDLAARYSVADGGRTIDVPVGDLVNPIYGALGRLEPGSHYPTVANQQIPLLRPHEQETKLVLTQPLYDARLGAGRDFAAAGLESSRAGTEALRERVTLDVQQAYFALLEAQATVDVLDATLELARENVKANESLHRNGKATRDLVYRAEADLLETTQRRLSAANAVETGRAYVNQLCDRALDAPVPMASVDEPEERALLGGEFAPAGTLARLEAEALDHRRELRELDAARDAARASEALARAGLKPTLALSVEGGTQGQGYGLGADDRYVLASVVLRFNLFDGGGDRAQVRAAHAQVSQVDAQRADTESRIRLEVQRSLLDFVAARASIDTARKRLDAARAAFAISQKKRDLGAINQSEFLDARRALTDAALNLSQTRFAALSSLSRLDYATGRADRTLRLAVHGE